MATTPVRRRRSISAKGITSAQPGSIDRLVLGGGQGSVFQDVPVRGARI